MSNQRNHYSTGVTYSHTGDDWTNGKPVEFGPEWHRTAGQTADVVADLRRLGYDVVTVTR